MRLNLDNTDQTLVDRVAVETTSKTWRPIRDVYLINPNDDQVRKLQSKVTPASPAGSTPIVAGAPGNLSAIFAVQSPAKTQGRTVSQVSVTFNVVPAATYSNTRIWLTGYKGNPNPVLQTAAASGPVNFLLETTGETITVTGQPVAQDGSVIALSSCLSTTVVLNGVVSAPPSPTVSQTLVSIPLGYQFAYNQLNLGATQDVVDSYRIYRNTSNVFAGSTLRHVNRHDPTNANAVVVQDVTGGGQTFYYFITAVNTIGLESPATSAQSGAIVSGTANLDNDVSDGGAYLRSTHFAGDVVVDNGNFEASSSVLPPPGWSVYNSGNNPVFSYDTTTQFSGAQSLKMVTTAQSGVVATKKFACRAGDKIYISCQAKVVSGANPAILEIDFRNGAGAGVGVVQATTTSAAWTFISNSGIAPAGTSYFQVYLYNNAASAATFEFDEVYIRYVRNLDNEVQDGSAYLRTSNVLNDAVIENGNFESSGSVIPPPGWQLYGAGQTLSYDTSAPYSGQRSLKIVAGGAEAGVQVLRSISCRAGDNIFASCRAKVTAGTATMYIAFRDGTGTGLSFPSVTTTNAAYTLMSVTGTAPANAVQAVITLTATAGGTVFFDEVYMRAVRNLDTEVQDGSTYARVNTNPANGLNTGTAVASNGNLMLKNVAVQNGSTSGPIAPTTTSVIPDMTKTITTKGNPVTVNFTSTLSCLIAGSTLTYALYRDGVAVTSNYVATFQSVSDVINISITYTDPNPSAASHTYDIRWASGGSNQYQAAGTSRGFTVNEMG